MGSAMGSCWLCAVKYRPGIAPIPAFPVMGYLLVQSGHRKMHSELGYRSIRRGSPSDVLQRPLEFAFNLDFDFGPGGRSDIPFILGAPQKGSREPFKYPAPSIYWHEDLKRVPRAVFGIVRGGRRRFGIVESWVSEGGSQNSGR
jgi:hypothetical protein